MSDVWVCLIYERGVSNTDAGLGRHNEIMHPKRFATATRENEEPEAVTLEINIDGNPFEAIAAAVKPLNGG